MLPSEFRWIPLALIALCLGFTTPMGCSCGKGSDQPRVFQSRQFLTSTAILKLGEDCSQGGTSACLPQADGAQSVCLHSLSPSPSQGWICSRACGPSSPIPGSDGCPVNFDCVQLVPGMADSAVCAPYATFKPGPVAVRPQTTADARPPPPAPPPDSWKTSSPDGGLTAGSSALSDAGSN